MHSASRKSAAAGDDIVRKTIILLAFSSAIVHLTLLLLSKRGFSDSTGLLASIVFWGTLPFIVVAVAGQWMKMPKLAVILGIICLLSLTSLFWDVYRSATSSTTALGLATGPVILTIAILLVFGLCAITKLLGRPKEGPPS